MDNSGSIRAVSRMATIISSRALKLFTDLKINLIQTTEKRRPHTTLVVTSLPVSIWMQIKIHILWYKKWSFSKFQPHRFKMAPYEAVSGFFQMKKVFRAFIWFSSEKILIISDRWYDGLIVLIDSQKTVFNVARGWVMLTCISNCISNTFLDFYIA